MSGRIKLVLVALSCCVVLSLMLGTVFGKGAGPDDVYRHLSVFTEVLSRIKSEYVEEPNMEGVTLGAVNGLLEAIDPYASYLNEDQYKQYVRVKDTGKGHVGLVLSRKVGYVTVVDAVPGSPAARAGLETGDMLETIDSVATRDMPLAYAEILLHGRPGSKVKLTVLRVRQSAEPQAIELTREEVKPPPVRGVMVQAGIGQIRVESLEAGKSKEIARQVQALVGQGAEKIVLDLRRCASGDANEGLALANLFLDEGLITYLEGQRVPRQEFRASRDETVSRLPMVVLTNRGTAQGAEIAAAALLENKRSEVVGERTYGNAAKRSAVPLDGGGAVILSVAKYHSPAGKALQDQGVTPSVAAFPKEPVSEDADDDAPIKPPVELAPSDDAILQKGIEVLTKGASQVARDNLADAPAGERPMGPLHIPTAPRN
ncbi:MAG: PDZ domain-containing protein [Bryobacteraceae bacterium]|nr:PDZ domain-containing protein [Bryobacteraceae bacterium]